MHAAMVFGAIGAFAPFAAAQTAGTDNRDGSYVNFEEAPVHPVELVEAESELWVANVAAGTVSVFRVPGLQLQDEIPVGMGPVTVRHRPGTDEMWIACASSGALFIVDRVTRQVVDSFMPGAPVAGVEIPVEPAGLLFTPLGDKAYCTLSLVNQIVEIDSATRTVLRRIEFSTRFPRPLTSPFIHAEEPRAMLLGDSTLHVLSFESGNGTTASAGLTSSTMVDMWDLYLNPPSGTGPFPPPPDRDVISFALGVAAPTGSVALWRMGTLCFDLELHDGTGDFLVSNIDANNLLNGEFNFPISGIAQHRISRAQSGGATIPQATTHVDLNLAANRHPLLPTSLVLFALPNEMEQSDGDLLFTCCYDTRNTAVIDLATNQVIASLTSSGFGPRGLALDAAGDHAWVFNRADATIDEFDLTQLAPGTLSATVSAPVGFDPTPARLKRGRLVHIDASNSSTGTQSCNTCHVDGHNDRIAWLLGEFTGSLPALPVVKEDKKVKVTQSLRGIEETAPFHWRGDRADLDAFKPAFEGLLGGAQPSIADFSDFQAYVFSLTFPPNPNQLPSRELSEGPIVNAKKGKLAFETVPILRIATNTILPHTDLTVACVACHDLGSFNGTVNQIFNDVTQPTFADNPAHLRGLFDKDSDDVEYDKDTFLSVGFSPPLDRTVATGWGTANTGFGDGLKHFVIDLFGGPASDEIAITQFVNEFDSGTAIAAMSSFTLTQAKSGNPASTPIATYLMPQATAGNCDLAVKALLPGPGGARVGFLFDPASQLFLSDRASIAPQSLAQLDTLAAAGATLSFLGLPVATGWRVGIDRDLDFLLDGDEATTSPTDADSDSDTYLDGYEVRNGSDPANSTSVPTNLTPPVITSSQLVFHNSLVAKFRWTTDFEASSRVRIRDAGTGLLLSTTIDRRYLRHHVMVVRKLEPGRSYIAEIDGADQNLNFIAVTTIPFTTSPHFFQSVHSDAVTLVSTGTNPGGTEDLLATFTIKGEDGAAAGGATVNGRFIEWTNGVAATETPFSTSVITPSGITANYPSLHPAGSGAWVEVVVDLITTSPLGELHFHPHEVNFSAKIQL